MFPQIMMGNLIFFRALPTRVRDTNDKTDAIMQIFPSSHLQFSRAREGAVKFLASV